MYRWQAVFSSTGAVLEAGPVCEPRSYDLASSLVDLRWTFAGQGAVVTIECVDEAGAVVDRMAPLPAVTPLSGERVAELIARFRD